MTDIVERLHDYLAHNAAESGADVLIAEAADEIEKLRSCLHAQEAVKPLYDEIERLRGIGHAQEMVLRQAYVDIEQRDNEIKQLCMMLELHEAAVKDRQ